MDLTVIIPVFNTPARYISSALKSIFQQQAASAPNIVFVDDHSTDEETLAALSKIATESRVEVLTNAGMKGPGGARNFGVSKTTTDWLFFLDADDLLVPGAFALFERSAHDNPDAHWISGQFVNWYPDGHYEYLDGKPYSPEPISDCFQLEILHRPVKQFISLTPITQGTYCLRRNLYDRIGGFDESYMVGEDWLMWMKCAREADLYLYAQVVLHQRRGHTSLMSSQIADLRYKVYLDVYRDVRFRAWRKPLRWRIYRLCGKLAENNIQQSKWCDAASMAWLSAKAGRNDFKRWSKALILYLKCIWLRT